MYLVSIVDIDNYLTQKLEREPFMGKISNSFLESVKKDKPNFENINRVNRLKNKIIILTGRQSNLREVTLYWLKKNKIKFNNLLMRGRKDFSSNTEFKLKVLKRLLKRSVMINNIYDDNEEFLEKASILLKK